MKIIGEPIFAKDADGNLLTNGVWSYTYDSENHLAKVFSNGVQVASELYDPFARRVALETESGPRYCFYDGWIMLRETTVSGERANNIDRIWRPFHTSVLKEMEGIGAGSLLVERTETRLAFPFSDNNLNIVSYSAENGNTIATYRYDVFGNQLDCFGLNCSEFRFRFSTKYFDSQLYYFGYRHFAPSIGRWLSRDPIGELGGICLFAYLENEPIDSVDLLGAISARSIWIRTKITYYTSMIACTTLDIAAARLLMSSLEPALFTADFQYKVCIALKEFDACKDCTNEEAMYLTAKQLVDDVQAQIDLLEEAIIDYTKRIIELDRELNGLD